MFAPVLAVVLAASIESLQRLRTLTIAPHERGVISFDYARDAQYEYLATPRGLYRAPRITNGSLELVAFADQPVSTIASNGDALYAGVGLVNWGHSEEHTLLRSRDRGATFEPIDAGLSDCSLVPYGQPCAYIVTQEIELAPGRIFIEAGGNLLASGDDGLTWTRLLGVSSDGKPAVQTCPITFTRVGQRMVVGGECPLDWGWIGSGTLRPDLLDWSEELRRYDLAIENRNVQFIRNVGGNVVFASIEGALLKSTDGGLTWRFVLHYPLTGGDRYPYAHQFVASSRHPGLLVLGGFDKARFTGYLAYSSNGGERWTDISALVGTPYVELLTEDADGRLLVGLYEGETFTLAELVPGTERKSRRRAVRP